MPNPRPRKRTSASRTRRAGGSGCLMLVILVVAVALVVGGYAYLERMPDGSAGPGPGGSISAADVELARRHLSELTVTEWASMRGYSRDRFSHWRTVDGCDIRQTVLARDGDGVAVDDDCRVSGGAWFSEFDGVRLTDPGEVDVDHLVPLANAWRTGAADWDDDRRAAFANDLDTPQLIAVSATSNRAKGDQDPSQWKPPERGYWCQYAHNWVAVKYSWQLWLTTDEKDALADMLDTCR